jgi:hypothetical protein
VNKLSPDQGRPIGSDRASAGLELQEREVTVYLFAIGRKVPIALLSVCDASQTIRRAFVASFTSRDTGQSP